MAGQIDPESLTWRVTPDLLGVLDASGFFKHINPAWETTLGRTPAEVESRQFFDFIHPEDVEKTETAFAEIQQGKPILNFENRYRHKDGTYRWFSWNAVPEGDLFFCSARDVTLHKENAASLQTRDEEARLREQFVAVLGHDLRNPLAAADAAIRMLGRQPQSERSREYLAIGQESLNRMSELIDNVMDFARIRLGQGLVIDPKDGCDLAALIAQTVEEIRIGNPEATILTTSDLRDTYRLDRSRIGQLVSNLVANAVVHGRISDPIRVVAEDRGETIAISVRNSGDPIPSDAMPQLFDPFSRGGDIHAPQGLGLGLFIANHIALKHGGVLSVSSNAERTEFTFEMPALRPVLASVAS
ncbi:PAS domain-containing sensor histidine kinase [Gymnodinialimonas sp. 2305UL16-5]|uniref:PAS domain-containing sensor histidine kinase n=1 Tax=Gymnodinialimonas mytili TaxID=3126503 RepID=UPI0030A46655